MYDPEPEISPNDLMVEPDSVTSDMAILVWTDVDKDEEKLKGFFKGYRVRKGDQLVSQ